MTLEVFISEQNRIAQQLSELRSEIELLKKNPRKDIYAINELPFSKPTAYLYEKNGKLKITRIRGRSFVLRSDLLNFFGKEGR